MNQDTKTNTKDGFPFPRREDFENPMDHTRAVHMFCQWRYILDSNHYKTSCHNIQQNTGFSNNWKYCPFCGKEIKWED